MSEQSALLKVINILARLDELGILDMVNSALSDEGIQRMAYMGVDLLDLIQRLLEIGRKIDWNGIIALASSINEERVRTIIELIDLASQVKPEELRAAIGALRSDVGPVSLTKLMSEAMDEDSRKTLHKLLMLAKMLLSRG